MLSLSDVSSCPRDLFPPPYVLVLFFNTPVILFSQLVLTDTAHHKKNMVDALSQDACYVFE